MPILDRLDPELAEAVRRFPIMDLTDLTAARAARAELYATVATPPPAPSVLRAGYVAAGTAGHPDVALTVFRPRLVASPAPCLYWIHGGGYVLPSVPHDDQLCEEIVTAHGCVVVSVHWRRSPEHPFPAAAEDCYAGLLWTMRAASNLQIDLSRVAVGGRSSGGGSAASLALLVRDRGEVSIAHQLLIYPMLDDTNSTSSSHAVTDAEVWNRTDNQVAWRAYLGDACGTDQVSPYAAPSRMADLSGLAPATVLTGELDLFVDEDITYAQRLIQAGVPTELHVYPAAHHGFDRMVPGAAVSRQLVADRDAALARAFARPRKPPDHGAS
jgi:acetyl esterase/lipase